MNHVTEPSRRSVATTVVGDPLPPSVASYFESLEAGQLDSAAGAFSESATHASGPPDAIETDPRCVAAGRVALNERLRELETPSRHEIVLCVHEGSNCMVEGVRSAADAGSASGSFAASVRLDGDGLIDRYLEYACPETIVPSPAESASTDAAANGAPADAFAALERYFTALDGSDFVAAAAVFSPDVLYSHPPYMGQPNLPTRRVDFYGRDALYERSFSQRAPHTLVHRVLDGVQRGPHCIVEGIVKGLPDDDTVSFISSLTLDSDGLIRRYASWCSRPSVPR